jgi:hypothetical protein
MQVTPGVDLAFSRALSAAQLPACETVLDITGDLFTHRRQLKHFVFHDRIVGLLGKSPPLGCFVPEIVRPVQCHVVHPNPTVSDPPSSGRRNQRPRFHPIRTNPAHRAAGEIALASLRNGAQPVIARHGGLIRRARLKTAKRNKVSVEEDA